MHIPVISGFTRYASAQDVSVNWARPAEVGRLEARYVRRCSDYLVVYLSSQTGCSQGCRMCHLTATGQTRNRDATPGEILEQARVVLEHYRQTEPARTVQFNFMARGEPLANSAIVEHADELLRELSNLAIPFGLRPRHLISTIYPREFGDRRLEDVFIAHHPDLHYSIYSMSDRFRRRWLPKAQPVDYALDRLASWQRSTQKIVTLHHAYISGENDDEGDVHAICDAVEQRRLMVHVNIVRYNPYDPEKHGLEPSEDVIERNAAIYRFRLRSSRVSIIARVGFDVAASCGMFLGPELIRTS